MIMVDKIDFLVVLVEFISFVLFFLFDLKVLCELVDDVGSEIVYIDLDELLFGLFNKILMFFDCKVGCVLGVFEFFEKYCICLVLKFGMVYVIVIESFVGLVNCYKIVDSVIFVDIDWMELLLLVVIDYYEVKVFGFVDWLKYCIVYDFLLIDEWKVWVVQDGQLMDQVSFVEWFEVYLLEFLLFDSWEVEDFFMNFGLKVVYLNEIMVLMCGILVNVEQCVKNNVMLQSGEGEIIFEESYMDGKGNKFIVLGFFILLIKLFKMGNVCCILVCFCYCVNGGMVKWFFKMLCLEEYIMQEILCDCECVVFEIEFLFYYGVFEV